MILDKGVCVSVHCMLLTVSPPLPTRGQQHLRHEITKYLQLVPTVPWQEMRGCRLRTRALKEVDSNLTFELLRTLIIQTSFTRGH